MSIDPTQAHSQFSRLIGLTVGRFMRRYGGRRDDLESHANELFMDAVAGFDPGKNPNFGARLVYTIWYGLLEAKRRRDNHGRKFPTQRLPDDGGIEARGQQQFDPKPLLAKLSAPAANVLQMALQPPLDTELRCRARSAEHGAGTLRQAIKETLAELGWAAGEIAGAFEEIRRAL